MYHRAWALFGTLDQRFEQQADGDVAKNSRLA